MFLGLSCEYLTPQTIHAAASQDVTQNITYETNKNTNNIFTPQVDGQPFSNLIDFFDTIKQSPGASSGFFDQILKNYNENGQKHFIFEVQKDKHGSLCFKLIYGNSAGIDPMEDYNPNRDDYVKGFQEHIKFQESVQDNEKDPLQPLFVPTNDRVKFYQDYSQKTPYSRWKNFNHFVVFSSSKDKGSLGTTLVVPKEGYTSVLRFAINATDEEKKDAISTLSKILTDLRDAGLSADFGIHTGGGDGLQSAAHLHFRVTIKGEPTFDELEQKFTELEKGKQTQVQVETRTQQQSQQPSVSGSSNESAAASSSSSGIGATGGSAKGKKKASMSKTSVSKRTSKTTGRKKFKKSRIKKRLKSRKRTK
jgi:hypothetical protein